LFFVCHNGVIVAHTNEEDWAAKARAWADAKSAMDNQHPQPHYSPAGRLPEQTHYHDPYQQSVDPRYTDVQNHSHSSSGYQQFSFVDPSMQRNSGHSQEAPSANLEAAYTSDGHSYSTRDGTSVGDPTTSFEQANLPTFPSVHPQEVPSSYSSVAGNYLFI
jgi:beta-arabinofuranosyltransferase